MKTTRTVTLILIVSETRDPNPSSTFPAAPAAIDVDGETLSETTRPIAKVIPLASKLRRLA
jgi:hypothetical protein